MRDSYRVEARLALLALDDLLPHEQTLTRRLAEVLSSIRLTRTIYRPVIVDRRSHVIIDGHHRVESLRLLGARYAPVILVDYDRDIAAINATRPLPSTDPYRSLESLAKSVLKGYTGSLPILPASSGRLQRLDARAIVEVAESIGVLPAKSTSHVTWAKRVYAPIGLENLY